MLLASPGSGVARRPVSLHRIALTDAMVNDPAKASAALSARIAGELHTTEVTRVKLWSLRASSCIRTRDA